MNHFPTLNPAVKLVVLTVVSVILLFIFDPWTPMALYVIVLAAALAERSITPRALLLGQLPFAAFALSLLMVNAVTRDGPAVAGVGPLTITTTGLGVGGSLALRTMAIGVAVILFIRTTPPAAFVDSLRQNLRLPPRPAYAVLAGYRVLDELPAQWQTLIRANAVRRPTQRRSDGSTRTPIRVALRAAVALLAVSIRRAERLSIAMETRGLGTGTRSSWRPRRITGRDLLAGGVVIVVFGAVVATSAALGLLRGGTVL